MDYKKFGKEFGYWYNKLYDACGSDEALAELRGMGIDEDKCVTDFDTRLKENKAFKRTLGEFVDYRRDFISSDREAAAFVLAYDTFYKEIEIEEQARKNVKKLKREINKLLDDYLAAATGKESA